MRAVVPPAIDEAPPPPKPRRLAPPRCSLVAGRPIRGVDWTASRELTRGLEGSHPTGGLPQSLLEGLTRCPLPRARRDEEAFSAGMEGRPGASHRPVSQAAKAPSSAIPRAVFAQPVRCRIRPRQAAFPHFWNIRDVRFGTHISELGLAAFCKKGCPLPMNRFAVPPTAAKPGLKHGAKGLVFPIGMSDSNFQPRADVPKEEQPVPVPMPVLVPISNLSPGE